MPSEFEPSITPEMRARYLLRRQSDFEALRHALDDRDFAIMKSIAHNIKGNAATFSYFELERMAVELETHAANAVIEKAAIVIQSMKDWLALETT